MAALQEAELSLLHKSANICGINKKSSDVPLPAQSSSSLCVSMFKKKNQESA